MTELQQILCHQYAAYPQARLSDYVKLLYQNEFGCGHFSQTFDEACDGLNTELRTAVPAENLFENIGNGYVRMHLRNAVDTGFSPSTIARLFRITARNSTGTRERFIEKLDQMLDLCKHGKIPLSPGLWNLYMLNYAAAGFPPVHHSAEYCAAYHPSYRVLSEEHSRFFELYCRIDRLLAESDKPVIIAIDGQCASGKTYLAAQLAECYDCNVFHTDDFYLRPEQKTAERLREVGGNMDRERLCAEILAPLAAGKSVFYQPFSCQNQALTVGREVSYKRLNIIEGAYSFHPDLRQYYKLSVALTICSIRQMSRLKRRESRKSLTMFEERWIPLENEYIAESELTSTADLLYSF